MFRSFVLFALLALPSTAFAEIANCLQLRSDTARLACYDEELGYRSRPSTAVSTSALTIQIETSDMTDQTNVFMSVEADSEMQCSWGSSKPRLIVRCRENNTAVILSTSCHMTSSQYNTYGDVLYRLGSTSAKTVTMQESTNNRSLGLWRGREAIPFISAMFGHDTMRMRTTPFSENASEFAFDISGLSTEITPLRAACNW